MKFLPLVADSWAFSERPIEVYEIRDLYVPFNELSDENPEAIIKSLEKSSLLYLIEGRRGEGKSCFLRFLMSYLYETKVFTILINTFGNQDYSDPNLMAKWIIGAISRAMENYEKTDKKTIEYINQLMAQKVAFQKGSESGFVAKVGGWFSVIPQILQINAETSGQIKRVANTMIEKAYFLDDRVACIDDLIYTITKETDFSKVAILIDGIDHMNVQDVGGFAEHNFTWLADLKASTVITVLNNYQTNPDYVKATKSARFVTLPRISSVDGFERFLNKRMVALNPKACWDDVCDKNATKLLFEWYVSEPDKMPLRVCLRSLSYAADRALHDGVEKILPYHMSVGIKDAF